MTTSSFSYFFSSDPKNGAILLDNTGSRFAIQHTQPLVFPKCKNLDLLLNSASIWYTSANISKSLYNNATFSFTYTYQTSIMIQLFKQSPWIFPMVYTHCKMFMIS